MREFVAASNGAPDVACFFEELRIHQLANDFDHKMRLYVALEALFTQGLEASAVQKSTKYLTKCIGSRLMSPSDVLWAFEVHLNANPTGEQCYAMVLKHLYDSDIVEEEPLLEHYRGDLATPGFVAAKKAAVPFLQWLETAEESSSDDE